MPLNVCMFEFLIGCVIGSLCVHMCVYLFERVAVLVFVYVRTRLLVGLRV